MAVDADAEEEADDRKRVGPTPRAVFDLGDQFGDGGAQGFRQAFRQAGTQEREGIGNGDLLEGGFGKGILSGSAEVIGDEDEERGPKMVIGEGITQFDELAAGDKERVAVVNLAGEDVNLGGAADLFTELTGDFEHNDCIEVTDPHAVAGLASLEEGKEPLLNDLLQLGVDVFGFDLAEILAHTAPPGEETGS